MRRKLGTTDLQVSPVSMGCWPITGMTTLDANEADSLATLVAAYDAGINFFDTAYGYGMHGESEQMIARALGDRRQDLVIATKCGLDWEAPGQRRLDGSEATLRRQVDESLRRLNSDRVELLYLHAPDPHTPIEVSAAALAKIQQQGKALAIGVSNVTIAQLRSFHEICPVSAVQPPYNMLQRQIEADLIPWCMEREVAMCVYWPLLKGLLAGHLARDHVFQPGDGRAKYPMFQGDEWQQNQDLVDALRDLAADHHCSVAELVIAWTIRQPGITSAICGAKRDYQIRESAKAMRFDLTSELGDKIAAALARRGTPKGQRAV